MRKIEATILIVILLGSMLGFALLHELASGGRGVPRDSDGDGYSDIDEMLAGTDPNDPCDPDPECDACLFLSYVRLDYPIENVTIGEPLIITGTATHRADGFPVYISVSGPTEFPTQTALLINGTFNTTFDTTGAEVGAYLVRADDLYGSTDEATVFLIEREAKTWYVDDDGGSGIDFTNIQDAIDAANGGDIIYVYNGTYNGNLYIWKSITLQGENPEETFVKLIQNNSSDIVVAGTENVIVSGFTMIGNKSVFNPEETHLAGVELYHVNNCTISNNIISDFWGGIGGSELSFCNFTGNDISNNPYGIYVWNCSYTKIADNRVYSNGEGIAICGWSCNNTITNNSIFLNGLGASTGNYCDFNRIYHNDFVENDEQAYNWNLRTNFWDNGHLSGGNYWHGHSCSGNPSDGSLPYYIKHGARDKYPFENSYGWIGRRDPPFAYANFTFTPDHPKVNEEIIFNASNSYVISPQYPPKYYIWDFGDGNSTTTREERITHSYSIAGNYTVFLIVDDGEGNTDEMSKKITIYPSVTKIWYVDDDGGSGIDFTNIQDAIDAANEGDTIYVYNGTYYERISIPKSLTLIGENRSANIIGMGSGKCVYITASNVTIEGFTICNGDYGVYIDDSWDTIDSEAHDNVIINNTVTQNHYAGIHIDESENNFIINNTVNENRLGVELYFKADNNTVDSNNISFNDWGGIRLYTSSYNIVSNNVINSNEGEGIELEEWFGEGSDYNIISDNVISNNRYKGVVFEVSSHNEI